MPLPSHQAPETQADRTNNRMSDAVRQQVQTALGAGFSLGRELGGGGMSRVFVARDKTLDRDVVIKVLAPELAQGLSADRFVREIRLAAALQEPHIVPVLSSGATAGGLPYYAMPYVEGESLRVQISRGPVELGAAVEILRDVAKALSYAHAHGIVHRDIKPENVLLSSGTAVVTDFGIAKALSASRIAGPGGTLTQIGTSLGTPAYMAPEQATGDTVDHRADIYAWGVVAYELLAGRHPFAGKTTAQQLIAAHIAETPVAFSGTRSNVPAPLASLVMRCLAKEPGARPQSARAVLDALPAVSGSGEIGTPAVVRRRRRWPWVAGSIPVLLIVAAMVGWFGVLSPVERATIRRLAEREPIGLRVNRVVVSPLRNETGDPSLAGLGSLAADVLTSSLATLPSLEVVDARTATATTEVVRQIPRFFRRGNAGLALADELGAKVLVDGSYYLNGDSVRVRARVLDAATGAVRQALPETAVSPRSPAAGLRLLADRAVGLLRVASDPDVGSWQSLGSISIPASLAAQDAALAAYRGYLNDDTLALTHADRGIALDTGWAMPYAQRAFMISDGFITRRHALADSALVAAQQRYERMDPSAQVLVDLATAQSRSDAGAFLVATQRFYSLSPSSPEARYLLSRGGLLNRRPRLALSALRSLDPDRGISIRLGDVYWVRTALASAQVGEWSEALAATAEGRRRAPRSALLHSVDMMVAAARHDIPRLEAERKRAQSALGLGLPESSARALAILAARGGRPDAARMLARRWLTESRPPSATDSPLSDIELRVVAEDWQGALPRTESAGARLRILTTATWSDTLTQMGTRAIVLAHLGRRAEARALESAISVWDKRRWDADMTSIWRARIAAHLGDTARAVSLAEQAVAQGVSIKLGGLWTIDSDPYLLPLRNEPRFRALAQPTPEDGR